MQQHAAMPSDDGTRRRLLLISAAAASLTLGNAAWDVLGPLWCTAELGLDPDGWARLRSLRFTGTLVGTVLIGLAAGWWGARSVGIAALALAGAALGAIAGFGRPALVLALPVFGAAISAVFIALNTLTQQVGREQQARANSIYRSVGAGIACAVPVAATAAAGLLGYAWALGGAAILLAAGAGALLLHPIAAVERPDGLTGLLAGMIAPLRCRRLLSFMLLEQAFALCLAGGVAFTTLILARSLLLPDRTVGVLLTCGALAAFCGTLLSHRLQAALGVPRTILACWLAALAAALLLATAGGQLQAGAAVIIGGLAGGSANAPQSLLIARLGEEGREAQTFPVWKVFQGGSAVIGMQLCALLEPRLGMSGVVGCGAAGAILPFAALWWWSGRSRAAAT
jgi:hypothetical protein